MVGSRFRLFVTITTFCARPLNVQILGPSFLHHKSTFLSITFVCLFRLIINLIEFVFKIPIIMLEEPLADRTISIRRNGMKNTHGQPIFWSAYAFGLHFFLFLKRIYVDHVSAIFAKKMHYSSWFGSSSAATTNAFQPNSSNPYQTSAFCWLQRLFICLLSVVSFRISRAVKQFWYKHKMRR